MNRIVKRGLIVLAVLAAVPVFLIMCLVSWIEIETYWTVDEKLEAHSVGEWFAVKIAQGYSRIPSAIMNQPCDWGKPSTQTPECLILSDNRRNICRWWFWERCQPYKTIDLVLRDPERLGKMIHGIVDPCFYHWQYEKRQRSENKPWLSDGRIKRKLNDWCRSTVGFGDQRRSVVVAFKKNQQTERVRIRIDFPKGFTTPTRVELTKVGED